MKRGLQSTSLHVQSLLDTVLVWQGKLIVYAYSVVCFYIKHGKSNRLGEVCSHVAGLLFKVEALVRLKVAAATYTSRALGTKCIQGK